MRPLLLDLFCGAGGAAMGYHWAGFEVVGVDNRPQPRYPFEFIEQDALTYLHAWLKLGGYPRRAFVAVHASPPCQRYSNLRHAAQIKAGDHPKLIEPTRKILRETGLPYVIENVPGAPLENPVVLCGSMFGLGAISGNGSSSIRQYRQLRRHRLFESNLPLWTRDCRHEGEAIGVYGGGPVGRYTFGNGAPRDYYNRRGGYQGTIGEKSDAMEIDWMNSAQINQSIPPAYTEHIGRQLLAHLQGRAAA